MAKEFAKSFYKTQQWKKTRDLYAKSVGNICEICWANGQIKSGEIVHHKIHLDESNINNPDVTLAWSNLQLVCRDCHAMIHKQDGDSRRFRVEPDGTVIIQAPL